MEKLARAAIVDSIKSVPLWTRRGGRIFRTFEFTDFVRAIEFVIAVGKAAEKAWHHPDIDIRWNKVTLCLSTHEAGGLTGRDFKLAREFDVLAGAATLSKKSEL